MTNDEAQTLMNCLTDSYMRGDIQYAEYIRARFALENAMGW